MFFNLQKRRAPIIRTLIDQSALFRISEQPGGQAIARLTKFNKSWSWRPWSSNCAFNKSSHWQPSLCEWLLIRFQLKFHSPSATLTSNRKRRVLIIMTLIAQNFRTACWSNNRVFNQIQQILALTALVKQSRSHPSSKNPRSDNILYSNGCSFVFIWIPFVICNTQQH